MESKPALKPRPKNKNNNKNKDVLLVHSKTQDASGFNVVRCHEAKIEVGTIRPLQQGMPIQGTALHLTPREESPALFDVDVLHESPKNVRASDTPALARTNAGPAQVSSRKYRTGWTRIFGGSSPKSRIN